MFIKSLDNNFENYKTNRTYDTNPLITKTFNDSSNITLREPSSNCNVIGKTFSMNDLNL